jgi:nitroreductase
METHRMSITPNSVDQAITSRQSTRAYLDQAVPSEVLLHILDTAGRAPSGTNTQPWKVYVLQGDAKAALVRDVCAAHDAAAANPSAMGSSAPYDYYPEKWVSPYIDRRRECGFGLYGVLGIGKGDKAAMHAQHQRNFRFFDAPVGLMFTLPKIMGRGSMVDIGMFIQNIMVCARGHGLDTCPQAAWLDFSHIVMPAIGAAEDEMLVCGLSLGYADASQIVNTFRTSRVSASEFTTFV